jgi:hypothetical protein
MNSIERRKAGEAITVVVATNSRSVLDGNLLLSPDIAEQRERLILTKEGFLSASLAYNDAMEEAATDLLIFVHQDVYLPTGWFDRVRRSIEAVEACGVRWGVMGCFGSRRGSSGGIGRVFTTGRGFHGQVIDKPAVVETLDEIVLITRKSSGLRFDPELPHFHMYGVDLCLQAREAGLLNYALPAPCVHNTNQLVSLPPEFYACHRYVKRKWRHCLPISASCMPVTHFDWERREKRVRDFVKARLGLTQVPLLRLSDPRTVLGAARHRPDEWQPGIGCESGASAFAGCGDPIHQPREQR